MDDRKYHRALPELHLPTEDFAEKFTKEADPSATHQALRFHCEAARCLEQLGEATQALKEFRTRLLYFERHSEDPSHSREIRLSIGQLMLAQGKRGEARECLTCLPYDAERLYSPHHAIPGRGAADAAVATRCRAEGLPRQDG
ncbi:hypothetical protein ACWC9R_23570 [Streptomyces sp. NPDC001219]